MNHLRHDAFTDTWVIVAPARRNVPVDPSLPRLPDVVVARPDGCPFCPGAEASTSGETDRVPGLEGTWRARAVLNRYPTVTRTPVRIPDDARFAPAEGQAEVIIEVPEHDRDLPDYTDAEISDVLDLWCRRLRVHRALPKVRHVAMFRNRGLRSGSTQRHPHGQLVSLPIVPELVLRRMELARRFHRTVGVPLLDHETASALRDGTRILDAGDAAFVTMTPFAPHRPFETWIVPRPGLPRLDALDTGGLHALAHALGRAVRAVQRATRGAAYNVVFRLSPADGAAEEILRWHVEILPRMGGDAGFELATEMHVSSISPEEAAAVLRSLV